jgi:N-methylhydantoinase A
VVHFSLEQGPIEAPVYAREELPAGHQITGPALIEEYASTTVIFEGDRLTVAPSLELLIDLGETEDTTPEE